MKKTKISILLILSAVMIVLSAVNASAAKSYVRGDCDGDSKVTILDVTAIQRKLASFTVSSFDETAADVDDDGLNITDATKIQRYLASYDDPYKIGEVVTKDKYELPFIPKH